MRRVVLMVVLVALACPSGAQTFKGCDCGKNPPGRPAARTLKPYAQEPEDMQPFSKFTQPYYQHYVDLVEYNGAARDLPMVSAKDVSEVRIGFIGPLENHPDAALGKRMLNGATLAVDEANAAGGYGGKPFKLMLHNDSAIWGASSNEVIKMVYDDQDWAIFGSISGDTTHIALRAALRAEVPIVNSASTDPTIVETLIPWYFTVLQDDRTQGYTLARQIYTNVGLKRIAILRVNDRYGRFGVGKFRDASRRLGHPVVIEQKFFPADTDFTRQLKVINESRVDGIVLWTDQPKAAMILKQMQELGMKQQVFGSHRTLGTELIAQAGPAAEGFEAVYPYDPTSSNPEWLSFNARYEARFHDKPDHFAALAYDQMQILLQGICRAGLNRAMIRDVLYGTLTYTGVTGDMQFDPNDKPDHFAALAYDQMQILLRAICAAGLNRAMIRDALYGTLTYTGVTGDMQFDPNDKQLRNMYLGTVHNGHIEYRKISMQKEYARVGEQGVQYAGPPTPDASGDNLKVAVFGPQAAQIVQSSAIVKAIDSMNSTGRKWLLVGISSDVPWGKASNDLVRSVYEQGVIGIIALDRASSHLAEQIGVKTFVPVIAVSSDHALTSTNIPWIFRLPEGTTLEHALQTMAAAEKLSGPNRSKLRDELASGKQLAGTRFQATGEPR